MMTKNDVDIPQAGTAEQLDRRFVYNGEILRPNTENVYRTNKPVRPRQRSPFRLIAPVVVFSLMIVVYIWNKISVNRLTEDVHALQVQYEKTLNANEILRAEINQKSRLERIGKIATEQLGFTYPKEQPVWFEVDPDALAAGPAEH